MTRGLGHCGSTAEKVRRNSKILCYDWFLYTNILEHVLQRYRLLEPRKGWRGAVSSCIASTSGVASNEVGAEGMGPQLRADRPDLPRRPRPEHAVRITDAINTNSNGGPLAIAGKIAAPSIGKRKRCSFQIGVARAGRAELLSR
jgi:hypothetical protein